MPRLPLSIKLRGGARLSSPGELARTYTGADKLGYVSPNFILLLRNENSTTYYQLGAATRRCSFRTRRSIAFGEEQTGRFELNFIEIDELGRGEFGRVMKARYKQGSKEVFAVKKSKRYEGMKHRYVLTF